MSIVPSFIGLRDPLTSLFARSGPQAQRGTVDTGPEQGAEDASTSTEKQALKEMQITQLALRQIERLDPLLQPIS